MASDLASQIIDARFFKDAYRHEMWHLLKNNYTVLSDVAKKAVLDIVADIRHMDDEGQLHKGATAHAKAIWLAALKGISLELGAMYREQVELVGSEPEHPDFGSYMSVGWVSDASPIPEDKLLSLEVHELASTLDTFKRSGGSWEPGVEGLAKALRRSIKAQPLRFHKTLSAFAKLDLAYVHEVVEAYSELWISKAQLPWDDVIDQVLAFIAALIRDEAFWNSPDERLDGAFVANKYWVMSSIARFIEGGVRNDDHAFPEKTIESCGAILLKLLERVPDAKLRHDSDALSVAINSPRGRTLEAFINLSLRLCRLADKKSQGHGDEWKSFEPTYNAELLRPHGYEFATLVVNYLPNFLYMSQEWVMGRLTRIFSQDDYQRWLCAMQGYAYVRTVYEPVYAYLKGRGDFRKGLDDTILKERVQEKIVQNIAVAYLNSFERLTDRGSLIALLVQRQDKSELAHLIWFVWTLRSPDRQKDDVKEKILDLWLAIVEFIDTSTANGREIAAKLADWIVFVDAIDERSMKLLSVSIPYAVEAHHSHEVLENLARLGAQQPLEMCDLWNKFLEYGFPTFPEEAIRKALAHLVAFGPSGVRNAKDIVSRYMKAGIDMPAGILNKLLSERAHNAEGERAG